MCVKHCDVQTCQYHIRLMLHLRTTCVSWHTHNRYTTHTTETQYKHNNTHHHPIIPSSSIMHPTSAIAVVSTPFQPPATTTTIMSYGRAWACARFTHTTPLIRPPPRRTPRGRRAPGWSGSLPVLFFLCGSSAPTPPPAVAEADGSSGRVAATVVLVQPTFTVNPIRYRLS